MSLPYADESQDFHVPVVDAGLQVVTVGWVSEVRREGEVVHAEAFEEDFYVFGGAIIDRSISIFERSNGQLYIP